ncbi:MAG: protein phosphatase 2C domain-containing protein [Phycisphaerales bacterium]|nr:protein phosphatase 2C domain-containing protein [Phycisphaerales bacterium]
MDKFKYHHALCSVAGNRNGVPKINQDRCGVLELPDGLVLVVCDGAGSKEYTHSGQGADLMTRLALDFFSNRWNREEAFESQARQFIVESQEELKREADRLGLDTVEGEIPPLERLSCTIAAAYVGDQGFHAMQIGDSFIFTRAEPDSPFDVVLQGHHDESNDGATRFITESEASSLLQVISDRNFNPHMVCLSSDWLKDMLFCIRLERRERIHNAIKDDALLTRATWVMRHGTKQDIDDFLLTYLNDPEVSRRYYDDRTMVFAIRQDQCLPTPVTSDTTQPGEKNSLWRGCCVATHFPCPYVRPENARKCNTRICEKKNVSWANVKTNQNATISDTESLVK